MVVIYPLLSSLEETRTIFTPNDVKYLHLQKRRRLRDHQILTGSLFIWNILRSNLPFTWPFPKGVSCEIPMHFFFFLASPINKPIEKKSVIWPCVLYTDLTPFPVLQFWSWSSSSYMISQSFCMQIMFLKHVASADLILVSHTEILCLSNISQCPGKPPYLSV